MQFGRQFRLVFRLAQDVIRWLAPGTSRTKQTPDIQQLLQLHY